MATDTLTAPVIMGTASRPKIYKNFIDDEWVEASTGETFENRNPADTRDVIGIFQRSGKADVEAAVDAAKRAFHKWRLVPAPRRAEIVYRAAEMLMERKEDYARDMTREMGKIVTGFGSSVGTPMTEHPEVRAVSLTGSTEVGRIVRTTAAKTFKHCSLELGGKNPMIVLDDANLDLAIEGGLWGGFGTTGQRC